MKIENRLPRFVRIKYMVKAKGQRTTRTVEFAPAVNDVDAEDYKILKDHPAYQGYIERGDFVEVKGPGSASVEAVTSENVAPTNASTSFPALGSGVNIEDEG